MASVTKDRKGFRIAFRDGEKKRRRIRVTGVTKRQAEAIAARVQALVGAKISGDALDTATQAWVAKLGDDLRDKLAEHGLVEARRRAELRTFINEFIESRRDEVSERTVLNWESTRNKLTAHFGDHIEIQKISEEDADEWFEWLSKQRTKAGTPFAKATISGHVKRAKRFFNAAIKARELDRSPLDGLVAGSQVNEERNQYVSGTDVEEVIGKAPDAEWRLIIALGRYAGLRMPSEALALTWADVDFERNRMTIRKGKTKLREMPILPQLRQYLLDCFDPEQTHVINSHRGHSNWGTAVKRLTKKAGLETWPRCFQNLRASLETDLTHQFPIHVVTAWLGNSPKVAADHYLSVRDADFTTAIEVGQQWGQQLRETPGNDSQRVTEKCDISAETQKSSRDEHARSTPGRIRTSDLRIRNPLLYPLSYRRVLWHIAGLDCNY